MFLMAAVDHNVSLACPLENENKLGNLSCNLKLLLGFTPLHVTLKQRSCVKTFKTELPW